MQSFTVIAFLVVHAQVHSKELAVQDGMDKSVSDFMNKLINKLFAQVHEAQILYDGNLDSTTLRKPGNLAIQQGSNVMTRTAFQSQVMSPSHCMARSCMAASAQWKGPLPTMAVLGSQASHSPAVRPRALVRASAEGTERSYVMVKPDGVQRGLVGEIIGRFERKGFTLKGLKLFQCPEELAKEHYGDLKEKPFFADLVGYICSGPVVCMAWEGAGVIKSSRKILGATNPLESEPGTIRGDYAVEVGRNVVHGSDSAENGEREIGLWFGNGEGMAEWTPAMEPWLHEKDPK